MTATWPEGINHLHVPKIGPVHPTTLHTTLPTLHPQKELQIRVMVGVETWTKAAIIEAGVPIATIPEVMVISTSHHMMISTDHSHQRVGDNASLVGEDSIWLRLLT